MGKLLRITVILLFLLGIVALILGIKLFQKRETLVGLSKGLADNIVRLSGFIEAEQSPEDLTKSDLPKMDTQISQDQLLKINPDPNADTNKPAAMKEAMALLIAKAQSQLDVLNDTRQALGQKYKEVDEATNKIGNLEGSISSLEADKKKLEDDAAALQTSVNEEKTKSESLSAEVESSKADVADLKDQVTKLKDTALDKDDQIKSLKETIERMQRTKSDSTNGVPTRMTPGTKGKILLVNKTWNFVVIGMDPEANLSLGAELTIQRDDKMVGKVVVNDINDQYQLAIADLMLAPWKQADPEVGDHVFY